jgi:hypothetical protein
MKKYMLKISLSHQGKAKYIEFLTHLSQNGYYQKTKENRKTKPKKNAGQDMKKKIPLYIISRNIIYYGKYGQECGNSL